MSVQEPEKQRRHRPRELKEIRKLEYNSFEERLEALIQGVWAIRSTLGQLVKIEAKRLGIRIPKPDLPEELEGPQLEH